MTTSSSRLNVQVNVQCIFSDTPLPNASLSSEQLIISSSQGCLLTLQTRKGENSYFLSINSVPSTVFHAFHDHLI